MSWSAIRGWKWKEIEGDLMQFNFANRDDAMNVFARRPWFVCGALLVIMLWPAWLTPKEVCFDKSPIWVHVESIPPFYWNLSNLKELASKASPVYELPQGNEDALGKDPTLRNQFKVQRAIQNSETAKIRECRMQLPSKRRIVTDSDEENGDAIGEEVITQMQLVYLPGIGELAPFGNNTKKVVVQDLIDVATDAANNKTKTIAQTSKKFENPNQSKKKFTPNASTSKDTLTPLGKTESEAREK
ncbi:hypothetical protein G4B88_007896 [Cannabis sativa]|uniref:DUF4283 domain-containing protein n=1 Tax=Cannabis sativa TaxID=3483 RepID=A0A7J6EJX4_CANSA|nr:hypothetical protein G4B88_007896 [Cannabis sativa]